MVQVHVPPPGITGKDNVTGGLGTVKKLLILALLLIGGFAVWRKVQARREDLDLWTEATSSGDY